VRVLRDSQHAAEVQGICNGETGGFTMSDTAGSCISLLSDEFGTFEAFIGQCDSLAKDIANKNPFGALGDGKRMKLLVAIAREWHQAKQEASE
jgi:hypothetical protein